MATGEELQKDKEVGDYIERANAESKPPMPNVRKKPVHLGEFPVRLPGDKYTPGIYGSTVLADGTVVLTDHVNDKVKVLNCAYRVKHVDGIMAPWGICSTDHNEVCVTQHGQLIFFKVKPTLQRLYHFHNIYVRQICSAVGYNAGFIYVGCGRGYTHRGRPIWGGSCVEEAGEIQAFTRTGMRLHSWKMDAEDNPIFSRPLDIAVSADGSRIHVADENTGVTTLNKLGEVVGRVPEPDPAWCQAVCVGDQGHVYACGYSTGDVLLLDPDGHRLCTLLTEADGIRFPTSVCYDPTRRRLIVGMLGDNIRVFQV